MFLPLHSFKNGEVLLSVLVTHRMDEDHTYGSLRRVLRRELPSRLLWTSELRCPAGRPATHSGGRKQVFSLNGPQDATTSISEVLRKGFTVALGFHGFTFLRSL